MRFKHQRQHKADISKCCEVELTQDHFGNLTVTVKALGKSLSKSHVAASGVKKTVSKLIKALNTHI